MKQSIFLLTMISAFMCFSFLTAIHSTTTIDPNNRFELGKNKHGKFKVQLKNLSNQKIKIYHAPIDGGSHSPQVVTPNQQVTVKVEANTALYIENPSNDTVTVKLKVTGDLGLSMGYQK
jgi:hypothetical protein